MSNNKKKDWRELCLAVSHEHDTTKLSSLVQELIDALDRAERGWRYPASRCRDNRDDAQGFNDRGSVSARG